MKYSGRTQTTRTLSKCLNLESSVKDMPGTVHDVEESAGTQTCQLCDLFLKRMLWHSLVRGVVISEPAADYPH